MTAAASVQFGHTGPLHHRAQQSASSQCTLLRLPSTTIVGHQVPATFNSTHRLAEALAAVAPQAAAGWPARNHLQLPPAARLALSPPELGREVLQAAAAQPRRALLRAAPGQAGPWCPAQARQARQWWPRA